MHDLRTENLSGEEEDLAFLLFFSGTTFSNIDSAMDPDSKYNTTLISDMEKQQPTSPTWSCDDAATVFDLDR